MIYTKLIELKQDGTPFVFNGGLVDFDSGFKERVGVHENFEFFAISLLPTVDFVDVGDGIKGLGVGILRVFRIVQVVLCLFCLHLPNL
jgi:hypothetical protein